MNKISKVKTTSSTNEFYNLFKTACKEIASEIISLKDRIKRQTPWENPLIIDKRSSLKEAAQINDSNPSQDNLSKYEHAKQILYETYDRVQENHIQMKIEEISTAVVNNKSSLAWKTVNEISGIIKISFKCYMYNTYMNT